jgi:1,4-dihydroxy-2-naphthoate octaprenyltransferase
LAVAFAITMWTVHDLAFSMNFLMFLLFGPLSVLLGQFANVRNSRIVAILASIGCGIASLIAAIATSPAAPSPRRVSEPFGL